MKNQLKMPDNPLRLTLAEFQNNIQARRERRQARMNQGTVSFTDQISVTVSNDDDSFGSLAVNWFYLFFENLSMLQKRESTFI